MKITKTKSGKWHARVYLGTDADGKQVVKSITGPSKKAVQLEAAELAAGHREMVERVTFSAACDDYFAAHSAVLSPSTVKGYKSMLKRLKAENGAFCALNVAGMTTRDVQQVADSLARSGLSPKYISNIYGFISAVLSYRGIELQPPKLPRKERPELNIPDEETVKRTIEATAGTPLEVPVLLAAFGPMRRGEICALHPEDISGSVIHVHRCLVRREDNVWVEKAPKTYSSDRWLEMPEKVMDRVADLQPDESGRLIHWTPDHLSESFSRMLKRNGIEHYRFHDLRHFCASDLHAQGVPDIYIQQRTGHSSPAVLRQVYTHTMQDQSEKQTKIIISHFDNML